MTSIQDEWKLKTIDEIVDVNPRIDKSDIPEDDVVVSFVPMAAVGAKNGEININQERKYSEVKKGFTPFKEGDVLFAKITPCMENGKMAVVPMLTGTYGFGSTEFHVLRPKNGIDSRYIYYFVSSAKFRNNAQHNMTGAVGQKRVPTNYLKKHQILIPPPDQQKQIVAKIEELFSHIDAGVAALQKAKQLLKQYRQSVLKAAVTGELTREWRDQNKDKLEPASELLKRILIERRAKWEEQQLEQFKAQGKVPKDDKWKQKYKLDVKQVTNEDIQLPEKWSWTTLQKVFDVITDGDHQPPPKTDNGIPFLVIGNVNRGELNFNETRFVSKEYYASLGEIRIPRNGDLLYTVVGSFGIPVKVDTDIQFCVQRHIAILKPSNLVCREYLFHILSSGFVYKQASDAATGTAQKTVGLGELRNIVVPLPPISEQIEIANRVTSKLEAIKRLELDIASQQLKAERNKSSILSSAFSGKLGD